MMVVDELHETSLANSESAWKIN